MARYNNILVAVDGSEEAKRAFKKSAEIAAENNAALVIAHVIDTRTFATIEQYDRTIVSRAETSGQELLDRYKQEAHNKGVEDVTTIIEFGSPRVKIPKDIAKQYNIDLIITGATGLNAVERMLIGSVSEAVARQARCDVMIVRS
ncbi:Nucleotide-binding universal stress protein, UspA family [Alteribacillus persepolensis]|uniref:Universal stress protein n=1 Tax=Alteribacillus persepolensis TaxID=568899 RepID=A0A1G8BIT5_9BACI|nr:universal stress protein [Alteribacillus persepolensis]SDH32470.1 Nucleotide-binding universal stress protein, UspA family [Alteribacillus persepolensis]